MAEPRLVDLFCRELHEQIGYLVEQSLVDDQRWPARRRRGNNEVLESDYWAVGHRLQRKVPYSELYDACRAEKAYDLRFLDGALVQVRYEFRADSHELLRSRAAFLPSPDLTPYQEDPELYLHDEVYGDVIDPRVVPVPLRFDFDSRPAVVKDLLHPQSHLTLGQYPHCRVALSNAITPYYLIELLLRSFYRTDSILNTFNLPRPLVQMPKTITETEQNYAHVSVPALQSP